MGALPSGPVKDDENFDLRVSERASFDTKPLVITQDSGPVCCLLTPKLEEWIPEAEFRVGRVHFKIESHDQGWDMGEEFMTKYMGSWTWFEAVIVRDFVLTHSNDGLLSADDITDRLKEAIKRRRKGELLSETEEILSVRTPVGDLSTVKNKSKTTKDVWPIQRNIRASKEPTLYEVYWSKVDLGFREELDDLEFMDMTGSGRGTGFVECLRPTDRIGVIGRAMYPGWINNVRMVEIEVWYMV